MFRKGRFADQNFRSSDHLYKRCSKEDVFEGRLLSARIPSLDISVNWSKYSKPWDVIFDHPGTGIARLTVNDLPSDLPKERQANRPQKAHAYAPSHEPEDTNYAHSEIQVLKEGVRVTKSSQVAETVKKEFRQIMSDRCLILRAPQI